MNLSCNQSEVYNKEEEEEADIRMCAQSADLAANYHIGKPHSLPVFTPFLHRDTRLELFMILQTSVTVRQKNSGTIFIQS
jgi:hypothetical protein